MQNVTLFVSVGKSNDVVFNGFLSNPLPCAVTSLVVSIHFQHATLSSLLLLLG